MFLKDKAITVKARISRIGFIMPDNLHKMDNINGSFPQQKKFLTKIQLNNKGNPANTIRISEKIDPFFTFFFNDKSFDS